MNHRKSIFDFFAQCFRQQGKGEKTMNTKTFYKIAIGKACGTLKCEMSYLADILGVSTASVYRWYSGKAVMSADVLLKILTLAEMNIRDYNLILFTK